MLLLGTRYSSTMQQECCTALPYECTLWYRWQSQRDHRGIAYSMSGTRMAADVVCNDSEEASLQSATSRASQPPHR